MHFPIKRFNEPILLKALEVVPYWNRKEWVLKIIKQENISKLLKKFSDICSYAVMELNCELNKNKVNY